MIPGARTADRFDSNVLQPNAHTSASYGAVRGIARLLRVSAANGICTSVMVSGVLAERMPESVRAIRDGGHELGAHSYGMGGNSGLSR
jgi:peptidoglycan/xylan/chitin deacetylase (PgdA/CDA1 family)